jgi:serine/threonine protein kinase
MVFEKLEGGTLLRNIHRRESLTEGDVSNVVLEITRGLECLHYNGNSFDV